MTSTQVISVNILSKSTYLSQTDKVMMRDYKKLILNLCATLIDIQHVP